MRIVALFILAFLLSSCQNGEKAILLRLRYSKGDIYKFRFQRYNTVNSDKQVIANEVITMQYKVDSIVNDSLFNLSAHIQTIKFKIPNAHSPVGDYYSSDDEESKLGPEKQEIDKLFQNVKKLNLTLVVNSRGRLVKTYTLPNNVTIAKPFSPINYQLCQIIFPIEPVTIGEEWKDEELIPDLGLKKTTTYKIEMVQDGVIKINAEGIVRFGETKTGFSGNYYINEKNQKLISAKLFFDNKFFLRGEGLTNIDIKATDVTSFPID